MDILDQNGKPLVTGCPDEISNLLGDLVTNIKTREFDRRIFDEYDVTEDGRVISLKKGKRGYLKDIKPFKEKITGYLIGYIV